MSSAHPFLEDNFHIRWSALTPFRVRPDIESALQKATDAIEALCATPPEELTFDRVLLGYERALHTLGFAWGKVSHLDSVANGLELRDAFNAMLPKVSAFYTSLTLNPRLWAVIKAYADTPEAKSLTGVRRRFLDETLAEFVETGADLPPDAKTRLEEINAELARHTQKYSENVLDSTNAWELVITDERELAGLPESARAAALQSARSKGKADDGNPAWRFTLHAPSSVPVMQYSQNETLRKRVWDGLVSVGAKGEHDNGDLVRKIVTLRDEKARILGKSCFADLTTARRMAKSGANALRFIETLHAKSLAAFVRETDELEAFKASATNTPVAPLRPWETAFHAEQMRRERYDFDPEAIRPYLSVAGVEAGMYKIAETLFGVSVKQRATLHRDTAAHLTTFFPATAEARVEKPPVEVWHPEVTYFEIYDGDTLLGAFYADWFPRESKRGGAWMNFLVTGGPRPEGFAPHLGLMCGNFTPPVEGKPALITHDEATTVFHEFGHLLHHLLCSVEIESLAGTRVAWDFVELPSQILENWCWQKESLDLFARHHVTGEPLPKDLLEKLVAAGNFRAASAMVRQLAFAKLDLDLHTRPAEILAHSFDDYWNNVLAAYQPRTAGATPSMALRFNHLFSDPTGYAAGYYSYKWAEVLEADAFTRFQKEGVLNPTTGRDLRRTILAKGNSEPAEQLFRDFMGRDPDPDALLRRDGLL